MKLRFKEATESNHPVIRNNQAGKPETSYLHGAWRAGEVVQIGPGMPSDWAERLVQLGHAEFVDVEPASA